MIIGNDNIIGYAHRDIIEGEILTFDVRPCGSMISPGVIEPNPPGDETLVHNSAKEWSDSYDFEKELAALVERMRSIGEHGSGENAGAERAADMLLEWWNEVDGDSIRSCPLCGDRR